MATRPVLHAPLCSLRITRIVLLWLALLLAIGQLVAIHHAYSHNLAESSNAAAGKHTAGLGHCHLCIVAAGIGGAPPPSPRLLLPVLAQHAPGLPVLLAQRAAPLYRPYAIRAPPATAS